MRQEKKNPYVKPVSMAVVLLPTMLLTASVIEDNELRLLDETFTTTDFELL